MNLMLKLKISRKFIIYSKTSKTFDEEKNVAKSSCRRVLKLNNLIRIKIKKIKENFLYN